MSCTCSKEIQSCERFGSTRHGVPGLILVPFRSSVAMMMHSDNVGHNKFFVFCDRNPLSFSLLYVVHVFCLDGLSL